MTFIACISFLLRRQACMGLAPGSCSIHSQAHSIIQSLCWMPVCCVRPEVLVPCRAYRPRNTASVHKAGINVLSACKRIPSRMSAGSTASARCCQLARKNNDCPKRQLELRLIPLDINCAGGRKQGWGVGARLRRWSGAGVGIASTWLI